MLERLLYISTIADGVTAQDVQRLVATSEIRNRRLDVTGLLVYCEVHFAQVLEGRSEALDQVMQRVERDSRHRDIRVVLREPMRTRLFGHWGMDYLEGKPLAEDLDLIYRGEADAHDILDRMVRQSQDIRP